MIPILLGLWSRWSVVIVDIPPYPHILSSATFPARALLRAVFERALRQGVSGGGQRVLPS